LTFPPCLYLPQAWVSPEFWVLPAAAASVTFAVVFAYSIVRRRHLARAFKSPARPGLVTGAFYGLVPL
jgi:hypothetical protein